MYKTKTKITSLKANHSPTTHQYHFLLIFFFFLSVSLCLFIHRCSLSLSHRREHCCCWCCYCSCCRCCFFFVLCFCFIFIFAFALRVTMQIRQSRKQDIEISGFSFIRRRCKRIVCTISQNTYYKQLKKSYWAKRTLMTVCGSCCNNNSHICIGLKTNKSTKFRWITVQFGQMCICDRHMWA